MNNCYMTLMTNEKFLPAVIRCNQSLKYYKSKYPFIVLIPESDQYLQEQLIKHDILYKIIHVDKFQEGNILFTYNDTINKFQIFNYVEYDYICFIDADVIFFGGNIDTEFDLAKKENSKFYGYFEPDHWDNQLVEFERLMGGLFIIQPDINFYPQLKNLVYNNQQMFSDDEEILKLLFSSLTKKHSVPNPYTHFGGFIKPWELKKTNLFIEYFFYENLSIEEVGYWLDHIPIFLGEFRTLSNCYDRYNFNSNNGFFVIPQTEEDIKQCINYQILFSNYGHDYPLIICIDPILLTPENDLLNKLDKATCSFKLIHNIKNKNLYQQFKFLEQEFKGEYNRICFIPNLNFQLEENLDLLLSPFTSSEIRLEKLKKYKDSLIYI